MGITAVVMGGIALGGTAYEVYQGEEAKGEAKKAAKKQEAFNKAQEASGLMTTTKKIATDTKSEINADQQKAKNTQKIRERARRQGKTSLLTGSESGLGDSTIGGL